MITLNHYSKYLGFSLNEYQEFQLKHLKKFVSYIATHSRHYKEKTIPKTISDYDAFSSLPLLEQIDLREKDIDEFRACSWKDINTVTRSSGTTGKSKIVLWTKKAIAWERKWGALGFLISEIHSGSRYAILMPLEMSRIPSILEVCATIGATAIPIGRITSEADEENAIELIQRLKVTHILASPTRLQSIGEKISHLKLNLHKDFQISYIIIGGMHSTVLQKRQLEKMWGATLFEEAGANELSYIGFECNKHNGLHILPGPHYVEVVDQETQKPIIDNKTTGEVLITAFSNVGTPLLRYRIGDLGIISYDKCICGLSFPRLFIQGRTMGTITIGGTKLFSYQIENILSQFTPLITLNYKVITKKIKRKDIITILIEANQTIADQNILSNKIYTALLSDSASIYKIYNKVKSGEVIINIELVSLKSLKRSKGEKIEKQFEDLR